MGKMLKFNRKKTMKMTKRTIIGAVAVSLASAMNVVGLEINTDGLQPVPRDQLPRTGTFWLASCGAPLPCPPQNAGDPIYDLGNGQYYADDSQDPGTITQWAAPLNSTTASRMSALADSSPLPDGGATPDGGGGAGDTLPDISNYQKYMAQSFTVVDTNDAAVNNPALYNACAAFANDTNGNPVLQIAPLGRGTLVMKASHFNYSGESRNFCVVVCDKLDTPLYKAIDLYAPSNNVENGGWLVQGSVAPWQVTDPMYLVVSNISTVYNGFFRVVPYDGPVVTWSGANPNDTVSNLVTLQASVTDLSGVTTENWSVNISGMSGRYTLGAGNTFIFDTKYNPNGGNNINLSVGNQARIFDTNNLPDNAQVFFRGGGSIPLNFQNDQYLAFASDWCPPEAGTNYIYYYLAKTQPIACTISSPVNGRVVATYSGTAPAGLVAIPWSMTEADGVTPYSNDTYVVTFTAYDPETWVSTNSLDKGGNIRVPAGCFLTYEWEDPSTPNGDFLDRRADEAIAGNLLFLYQDIYDQWGLTEYYDWMVGPNRNWAQCMPYNAAYKSFNGIMQYGMTNSDWFSELTLAQAHGSGPTIGGGSYLHDVVWVQDFVRYVQRCVTPHNWRLRKACLFTCYNADLTATLSGPYGNYVSWPEACGIRPAGFQQTSLTYKNCGLFFVGGLPQNYINMELYQTQGTADVAELCDQVWVCGKYEWPGACDPTYSFQFAVQATMGIYPDLAKGKPALAGFPLCVYDAWQDEALRNLNTSGVKTW
jgi:hypothetical protein